MSTQISKRILLGKSALAAGVGVGALALLAPQRASADTPFTSFAFPATGAPTPRTMPDRLAEVRNVKDFGAKGDGVTDDAAAIQATFNAAFGSSSSPNGNAGKFNNRPVFFPAGNYRVGTPLYLTGVIGGHIFGAGSLCTRIFYTGPFSGNSVVGNGITATIMTNGFAYSKMEGLNLSIGNTNATCLYLYQDGTKGQTNGNTFADMLFDGASAGVLIGYQSNALCSEMLFLNCSAISCPGYGFRNISYNALNNMFIGCGAAACNIGFSCPTGSIHINVASLAGNALDIEAGGDPITITGSRTESAKFLAFTTSSGHAVVSGCSKITENVGPFVDLGNGNKAILDGCDVMASTIAGSGSSKLYLRGNTFRNASYWPDTPALSRRISEHCRIGGIMDSRSGRAGRADLSRRPEPDEESSVNNSYAVV